MINYIENQVGGKRKATTNSREKNKSYSKSTHKTVQRLELNDVYVNSKYYYSHNNVNSE